MKYEARWGRKDREKVMSAKRVANALKKTGFTYIDDHKLRRFKLPKKPRDARALWNEHRFHAFDLPPDNEDKEDWPDLSNQDGM